MLYRSSAVLAAVEAGMYFATDEDEKKNKAVAS
jgi:hypothetical protein